MKEEQLKELFKQQYSANIWQPILKHIFASVDFFVKPVNLEPSEKRVTAITQSGSILLEDGKRVGIFEVKVADKTQTDKTIDIQSNRQGLRDIAAQYIDQYATHAVLVFFYADDQPNYRLSLVAKWSNTDQEGYIVRNETNKRRYTYILGKHQNGTTAAKRLAELAELKYKQAVKLPHLIDTFSVEPLNKEFFAKYKEQYALFTEHLRSQPNLRNILIEKTEGNNTEKTESQIEAEEKPLRDFVKKLLGRIVFLHFLQKKGWLGCSPNSWDDGDRTYLQTLFAQTNNKDTFYSTILTTLFFDTLNRERDGDLCHLTTKPSRVPYLNGGLFEKTDSEQKTNRINFPAHLFQNLLDFFAQYNFTIDENSPEEQEVGIDPEMLGHIFENLLEDNKNKGAFYTPKEIVQYMCRESLIQYLSQKMPAAKDDIAAFIKKQDIKTYFQNPDNALVLSQHLDAVRICDPAIGSGAFPIGLLQEIYQAKRYIFPHIAKDKAPNFITTDIKRNIIQNSIYGVDLENGAVDIARLRFWLALVVDAEKPEPLPNLDYKIMQGNSLLEYYAKLDLSKIATKNDDKIIIDQQAQPTLGDIFNENTQSTFFDKSTKDYLSKSLKDYFQPIQKGKHIDKSKLKQKIEDIIVDKIQAFIYHEKQRLKNEIDHIETQFTELLKPSGKAPSKTKTLNKKSPTYKKYESDKELFKGINDNEILLIDKQKKSERPFFLWHTWFKDVFEENKGFDIVIGNPPYLRVQGIDDVAEKNAYTEIYKSAKGAYDLYILFVEHGFKMLAPTGILNYIIPDKWVNGGLGKGLRNLTSQHISRLISFKEHQVFNVSTYSSLLWVSKAKQSTMFYAELDTNLKNNVELEKWLNALDEKTYTHIDNSRLTDDAWTFSKNDASKILDIIARQPRKLADIFDKIFTGLQTSGDDVYFLLNCREENGFIYGTSKALNKEVCLEKGFVKPLLKGNNVHRYEHLSTDTWVIFPYNIIPNDDKSTYEIIEPAYIQKEYPNAWLYLTACEDLIKGRERDKLINDKYWYKYIYPKNLTLFNKPKILCPYISFRSQFSYDINGDYYTNTKVYGLIKHSTALENEYFLLALLNSSVLWFFMSNVSAVFRGGYYVYSPIYLQNFKIPEVAPNAQTPFIRLVEYILWLKRHQFKDVDDNFMSTYFEQIIDVMVYELYFGDTLRAQQKDVLQHLQDLQDINQYSETEKLPMLRNVYQRLYHNRNPVRAALYYIDTVPEVRIILGKQ